MLVGRMTSTQYFDIGNSEDMGSKRPQEDIPDHGDQQDGAEGLGGTNGEKKIMEHRLEEFLEDTHDILDLFPRDLARMLVKGQDDPFINAEVSDFEKEIDSAGIF